MIYKNRHIICGGGHQGEGPKPKMPSWDKPKQLRKWQPEAYLAIRDSKCALLRSPVGSGKTLLAKFVCLHYLKSNPLAKVIFTVPEDLIGPNYTSGKIEEPDGTVYDLSVPAQNDLCRNKSEGCFPTLMDFLTIRAISINDRIAICTHAAICDLYSQLKKGEKLAEFDNLMLVVDEAHRLYILGEKDQASSLGNVVRHFVTTASRRLLLMSGSFFRSDGYSIIPTDLREKLNYYELPYDRYLSEMEHLREFFTQFVFKPESYEAAVDELLTEYPDTKWIFYLPPVKTPQEYVPKLEQVKKIVDHIGEVMGDDGITMLVKREGKVYRIINLVDETNRTKKKEYLYDRSDTGELKINQDRGSLDIIITLNMVVEGFDWQWASHAVTLGARNSQRVVLQISGRVLRDVPGKSVARLTMVLPPILGSNEETLEMLNNYYRGILMYMLHAEILKPTKIEMEVVDSDGVKRTKSKPLLDLIPEEYRSAVIEKAMQLISSETEFGRGYESYLDKMEEWLGEMNVPRPGDIAKGLWRMSIAPWAEQNGYDVSVLQDIDLVKVDPLLGFKFFAKVYSARAGRDLWPLLRTILCKSAGVMLWERAMTHCSCIGVSTKDEYLIAAKAEISIGRPLVSRRELDLFLDGKKLDPEEDDVRVPILSINPERAYGSQWPGWPYFLGKGPRHPASLVLEPKRNQKLYWVLKEVLWCHKSEHVVRFGETVDEVSKFFDPNLYQALSNKAEAEKLGEERRAKVKGLPDNISPPSHARSSFCENGILEGLRGLSWVPSEDLVRRYFLAEGTVIFMPKGNGCPLDDQLFPIQASFVRSIS